MPWPPIAIRLTRAGKARHHPLGEEAHRSERSLQRDHVEIDLQRGVLVTTELVPRAADLIDDLGGRTDPRRTRRNLVRGARLSQFRDDFVVARIIPRRAS